MINSNKKLKMITEGYPCKCKVCGLTEIKEKHDICEICGWEDDLLQNNNPDYMGGANEMSLNQYKKFWKENKEKILKIGGSKFFYAVDLANNYYNNNFKNTNLNLSEIDVNPKQEKQKSDEMIEKDIFGENFKGVTDYQENKEQMKIKLARGDFETVGKYNIPLIKKQNIDLDKVELLSYLKTKNDDKENKNKTIHFFTYDWNFENVYEKPELALEKLDQYYALLTPEFSLYWDMPKALQIYSTFKNRWCGAFWQKQGMLVIPTICCSGKESYDFCFDGIEEGSIVAISTYRREKFKEEILKSYNKMLEVIKPSAIICYGTPFPEMKGNIKAIDPFNKEELIKKIGLEEFTKKYLSGELYPEI